MSTSRPTNRLAQAASPYLLSHAHNPVDWYPWGPEALERAKREDKPVFVSIGYAACHWCHVMERESFEDEAVAQALNRDFIAIKVDREERPDVDQLYMTATIAMTGSGGWPMSVFITPDGRPFFAGTYFPKESKYGRPGFIDLLSRIAQLWQKQRTDVERQADTLLQALQDEARTAPPAALPPSLEKDAIKSVLSNFDEVHGGFGPAPKFPAPFTLALLLRHAVEEGDDNARHALTVTLDRMAAGGIYDHVGGGFARYSTDKEWHVPHFEKMLYDNAQLVRVYAEAFRAFADPAYAGVVRETLDYLLREMQDAGGGFYSATDADSEGVEGKFFVWSKAEFDRVCGDQAELLATVFDVSEAGNWEGHNVLRRRRSLIALSREANLPLPELNRRIDEAKEKLRSARNERIKPLCDDKILTAWNGLTIGALAVAGALLQEPRYLEAAQRCARFILSSLRDADGRLLRAHRAGTSHIGGFLEDYAFFAEGLIELYEATGEGEWLRTALALAERAVLDFRSEQGPFFNTASHHEQLAVRMYEGSDGATASPNAVFARVLVRLGAHFGREDLRELAQEAIVAFGRPITRLPRAFMTSLDVARKLAFAPLEVALVGSPTDPNYAELNAALLGHARGFKIVARASEASVFPLLAGKAPLSGESQAFVCRDFACEAPVRSGKELAALLDEAARSATASRGVGRRLLAGSATAEATKAFAPLGTQLGELTVSQVGVMVGSLLEDDAARTVELAVQAGINLFAFDAPRAPAVGEGVRRVVAAGTPREALVLIGLLPGNEAEGVLTLTARAGVQLDLALLPTEVASVEAAWEMRPKVDAAVKLGLYLKSALPSESTAALVHSRAAQEAALVAVPFNVLTGDVDAPSALAAAGGRFVALRPLECAFPPHTANFLEPAQPNADTPTFAAALERLAALEAEFGVAIAPRLSAAGGGGDASTLLRFSEELVRAEQVLDDIAEIEAFVHQSLAPAIAAAWGALEEIGGELGGQIKHLRERYLDALDRSLRSLANAVIERQAKYAATLAETLSVPVELLAGTLLGAVSRAPGVQATLVTIRKPEDVQLIKPAEEPWQRELFENARRS